MALKTTMPLVIPFFLMNRGCPHRCSFCNERLTAGDHPGAITEAAFVETVCAHLATARRRPLAGPVEIAFYGGTFTGMPRGEQRRLLALAAPFLREGEVDGVRVSTRPDEIDAERLDLLEHGGVTTVEVGVQSFDDGVLFRSRRGHTAADAIRALHLLKERCFQTGLHLMAGLPGEDASGFDATVTQAISLRPDMVRIHPTLVLRETPLALAFRKGEYVPLGLNEAVEMVKQAWKKLAGAGIPIIRMGLQTTPELETPGAVVAGPFHPAFRSLVEEALFREMAVALLQARDREGHFLAHAASKTGPDRSPVCFTLSPADLSNFYGRGRENLFLLKSRFPEEEICVTVEPRLPRHSLCLAAGKTRLQTDLSGEVRETPWGP